MATEIARNPQQLTVYQPKPYANNQTTKIIKPSGWFSDRYPDAYLAHGSPFAELVEKVEYGQRILPACLNYDFMACVMGGRKELGHQTIYHLPDLQFYFKDSDGIFKNTTAEKLMIQYRAVMMMCAQSMPPNVCILNLVEEWRGEKVCKTILQRAKSVLAADHTFFAADAPNQRVEGPELYDRLIRALCESMVEKCEAGCLTVTDAYALFCKLAQQRGLGVLKRSVFKENMREVMRDVYGLALRHDVPDSSNRHQQAWKGLRLLNADALPA